MIIDKFGYLVGFILGCVSISFAIYTGVMYERYNAPEPCITNLSVYSYPNFEWEQIMLDNVVEYDESSDFYREGIKTSETLAHYLVKMSENSNWPSEIYENAQTGRKFYVPGLCYVGRVDFFGDPILYRK